MVADISIHEDVMDCPTTVTVRIPVVWKGAICMPCKESEHYEEAIFRMMTFGDNYIIEQDS